MIVRRILASDWDRFRTVRLRALGSDPRAFGSTLERELAYPPNRWQEWATAAAEGFDSATFLAEAPGRAARGDGRGVHG